MRSLPLHFWGLTIALLAATSAQAQYCTTNLYSYGCGAYGDQIQSVSTTGGSTNISNLNSGCNGGYAGYSYITNMGTLTIQAGQTFAITVVNNPSYSEYYSIYVDFNGDGDFSDPGETVYYATSSTPSSGTVSGAPISVPVPVTATPGNTRLRVRCVFGSTASSACSYQYGGEIEDYPMVIVSPCNGPTFSAHPADRNFCINGAATFTATAASAATYNWQVNTGTGWTNISNNSVYSGATTNTLSLSNIPAANNGYSYRLKAVSGCGTPSYSNAANLTFFPPVAVASQTTAVQACVGAYTSLSVTASGPALNYQWQVGTLTNGYADVPAQYPYIGTNTATLEVANTPDSLNGQTFRCIVIGECSNDTSASIPVDVITGPYISQDPADVTVAPYNNAIFEIKLLGSPLYELYWQASVDNGATFVNVNNNSLYSGAHGIALAVINPHLGLNGMQFRCIMKSTDPACGLSRDTSAIATLKIYDPTSVSNLPADKFEVTLYPNPVNGSELFINAANIPAGDVNIRVFDKLGRVLYEAAAKMPAGKTIKVPVQNMPPGIYSVQLSDADKVILNTSSFTKQ